MPRNISMPGAWNDSWDSPDPVIHELDASISVVPTPQFTAAQNLSFHEALPAVDEVPPPYPPRAEAMNEPNRYNHSALRRDSGYGNIDTFPTVNGPQFFDASDSSADDDTIEDDSPPIVIAVFGQTGTGKTSLIKAVTGKDLQVGHDLASCTEDVLAVPCRVDGKNVVLVDTPGFSDTNLSDTEILRRIATWMKDNYDEGLLLSGIIYLHRIIDIRMEGPSLKNLRMMKKLCGEGSLANVVLATTMWEKVTEEEGARREEELKQVFWKEMITSGSTVRRILTGKAYDARALVKSMLTNRPTSTRLQEELRDGKPLIQTEAGIEIRDELARLEHKLKKEHRLEMIELKAAQMQRDRELEKQIRAEMKETIQRIARLEAENRELENLTLPKAKKRGMFGRRMYRCLYCDGVETKKVGRWTCKLCNKTQTNG